MSRASARVLASASTPRRRRLGKLARRSTRSFASTSSGIRISNDDASVVPATEARNVERGGGAETRARASDVTAPTMVSYVVARGDSLFSIAASHGVSTDDLVEANALGLRRSIEVGQSLHVPVNIDRASFAVRAKLRATDGRVGTTPATRKLFRDVWSLAPKRSSHSTMTFGSTIGKALPSLQVFGTASFVVAVVLTLVSRKPSRAAKKQTYDERQMAATVSAPVLESDAFTDGGDVAADEITETIEIRSASGKTKKISMPEPSDKDENNDDEPRWVGEINPPVEKGATRTLPKSAKKVDVARLEMRANRRAQSSARRLQRSSSRTAIRQEGHGASASQLPALVGSIIFDLQSAIERLRTKVR